MRNNPSTIHHLLTLLAGTWTGAGRGQFPTITSFDYRETLIFTRCDEKTLANKQYENRK